MKTKGNPLIGAMVVIILCALTLYYLHRTVTGDQSPTIISQNLIRQLDALDSGDVAVIPCNQYSQLLSILKNGENDEKISIGNRTFDLVIEKNRYYLSGDLYDIEIPIVDTIGQMSLKKTWIVEDEN